MKQINSIEEIKIKTFQVGQYYDEENEWIVFCLSEDDEKFFNFVFEISQIIAVGKKQAKKHLNPTNEINMELYEL